MSREAYHEYFQGHMEVLEKDKRGIERIKRVYVADYYRAKTSDKGWKYGKVFYLICWLGAALLFMISAGKNLPCNLTIYAGLTQALAGLSMLIWSFTMGECLLSERDLTIGKFQAVHDVMVKRSMAGAFFLGLCTVAALVGVIIQRSTDLGKEIGVVIGYLAAALLCLFAGIWEKRRVYVQMKNPVELPEGSIMIR